MRKQIERTGGGTDLTGGDSQVPGRGGQAAVAEQQLDSPNIRAGFQQVDCESVPQRMGSNRFADAGDSSSLLAGELDGASVDRLAGYITLEQPTLRPQPESSYEAFPAASERA